MDQLRWQRLPSFQKLAEMLLNHLDGILNYCRTKVRFGVVAAINGSIRMLINRGRGYKNMRYLLLKAKRMAVTNTEYVARAPLDIVLPAQYYSDVKALPEQGDPVTFGEFEAAIKRSAEWLLSHQWRGTVLGRM